MALVVEHFPQENIDKLLLVYFLYHISNKASHKLVKKKNN